ncbi:MAG: hypothetical protein KVP17_003358 [Porospora cf. gigantea B]|uniref:uncharacterized protein n=1 Tax=Porospora cf. gigantea B TaxID=2853592 RepID=UPI003571F0E9|nr:MAG: hypothetical protein KVP17_003358 [Porospora cf. gigantea B]
MPQTANRWGVVISHPDDEAMFFLPLIRALTARGKRVFVLCMTCGDNAVRKGELSAAKSELGIDDLQMVAHPSMRDAWRTWNVSEGRAIVADWLKSNNIQSVATFDFRGISSHPNHVSTHFTVKSAVIHANNLNPNKQIAFYANLTINRLMKYLGILLLPVVLLLYYALAIRMPRLLCSENYVVAFNPRPLDSRRVMSHHQSQFQCFRHWYRHVYVLFSVYVYLTPLKRESVDTV